MKCDNCHNDIELDNVVFFPYGKGRLCKKCYGYYDLDLKLIKRKFRILRGFGYVYEINRKIKKTIA